jgi:hypothetical protein
VKPLFELTEQREGIKDLQVSDTVNCCYWIDSSVFTGVAVIEQLVVQMETAVVGNSTRYYVMAVTPTRLYSFTGIGSLEVSINSHAFWSICWGIILIKLVGKASLLAWGFDVLVSVSAYVQMTWCFCFDFGCFIFFFWRATPHTIDFL